MVEITLTDLDKNVLGTTQHPFIPPVGCFYLHKDISYRVRDIYCSSESKGVILILQQIPSK